MKSSSQLTKRNSHPSDPTHNTPTMKVVGVGASAGGLKAFTEFLRDLSLDTGMAFVLIQHLDRDHKSSLADILARTTNLPINEITDGMNLEPNQAYVIPAMYAVTISEGLLRLKKREKTKLQAFLIDRFFISLAQDKQHDAIGVVLSGTGTDGTKGLEAIRQSAGVTFAHDKSAEFQGMPEAAIAAGVVDFILSPANIAKALSSGIAAADAGKVKPELLSAKKQVKKTTDIKEILDLLCRLTGTDFTHYKMPTLSRRITRRLNLLNLDSFTDYSKYLAGNRDEVNNLLQDLLINVTKFFRDPPVLQQLTSIILPELVANNIPGTPLRVWIAGCASGEEAYSMAIIIQEYLDQHALSLAVQIFATDLSAAVIDKARHGQYTAESLSGVSEKRIRQYFKRHGANYQVVKSIRKMCVFAPHNLATDPPFSRLDLVSCCNVLIYLQPNLQQKLLRSFHYALNPSGYLILGPSETVGPSRKLFVSLDKKYKTYIRKDGATPLVLTREAVHLAAAKGSEVLKTTSSQPGEQEFDVSKAADRLLLSLFVPASVVIDKDMEIVQFRGPTSQYLQPASGTASFNLMKMVHPDLALALRNAIYKVRKNQQAIKKDGLVLRGDSVARDVTIEVIPLPGTNTQPYLLVIFTDIVADSSAEVSTETGKKHAYKQPRLAASRHRIQILERDLEATREDMLRLTEEQDLAAEELL